MRYTIPDGASVSWMQVNGSSVGNLDLSSHSTGGTLKGTMSMIKPLTDQVHVSVLMRHVFSSRTSN
ncbi:MAG: hypothetical protein ACLUFP_05305 [Streptococcus salivarius]